MNPVHYFKALADETRLRLANVFLHHELNVNEIVQVMEMGQSRISRHLKILSDCGILTFRRDGMWTFYSAAREGKGKQFIDNNRYLFDNQTLLTQDLERARQVVKERSQETLRFFESIAEDWQALKREIIGKFDLNGLIYKQLPAANVAVDLGCGTGDLLPYLKKKSLSVIGIDKSPKMLEQTRLQYINTNSGIDLRIGALEHLPMRNEEADLVVINMVLHHIPSPTAVIQEIGRVMAANGTFIVVDFLKHKYEEMRSKFGDRWLGFSQQQIQHWLKQNHFTLKTVKLFNFNKGLQGFMMVSKKNTVNKGE